jgi:hypothetical protein
MQLSAGEAALNNLLICMAFNLHNPSSITDLCPATFTHWEGTKFSFTRLRLPHEPTNSLECDLFSHQ